MRRNRILIVISTCLIIILLIPFFFRQSDVIILKPEEPILLGAAGSFGNRQFTNGSTFYALNKWLVTGEWFFFTIEMKQGLKSIETVRFPENKVYNETTNYFNGLTYSKGLFYTIGHKLYRNHTLVTFSPDFVTFNVQELPIPDLYLSYEEIIADNSSTYRHEVAGIGINNGILWIYLHGNRPPHKMLTYHKIYGISLDTFELVEEINITRPFRYLFAMDEKGIFWTHYYGEEVNGTYYEGRNLIGYNLSSQTITRNIKGRLHEFFYTLTSDKTVFGASYSQFEYEYLVIYRDRVIYADFPIIPAKGEHYFNGLYIIPFSAFRNF